MDISKIRLRVINAGSTLPALHMRGGKFKFLWRGDLRAHVLEFDCTPEGLREFAAAESAIRRKRSRLLISTELVPAGLEYGAPAPAKPKPATRPAPPAVPASPILPPTAPAPSPAPSASPVPVPRPRGVEAGTIRTPKPRRE
jgi:hypothetical protein